MKFKNPHALYINCDGAMDYDKRNPGGIGFVVTFPDQIGIPERCFSNGIYYGGNIERLEYEALIQGMQYAIQLFEDEREILQNVSHLIFISDRFALNDKERTSPYQIRKWRSNGWRSIEGKPIKNKALLDKLDKLRKKLSDNFHLRVNIEYRSRKKNKAADKLAKAAKTIGLPNYTLEKRGEKIGKRKHDGGEVAYKWLQRKKKLKIHVFRKDPVQDEWEIWCDILEGTFAGKKIKLYAEDELAYELKRRNEFEVIISQVYTSFIRIESNIKNLKEQ